MIDNTIHRHCENGLLHLISYDILYVYYIPIDGKFFLFYKSYQWNTARDDLKGLPLAVSDIYNKQKSHIKIFTKQLLFKVPIYEIKSFNYLNKLLKLVVITCIWRWRHFEMVDVKLVTIPNHLRSSFNCKGKVILYSIDDVKKPHWSIWLTGKIEIRLGSGFGLGVVRGS